MTRKGIVHFRRRSIGCARPGVMENLYDEYFKIFLHPLRSRLDVPHDRSYNLLKLHLAWWAAAFFFFLRREFAHHETNCINDANTHPFDSCICGASKGFV